jgi:aerobic carbon-monoxide dehydrogenase medium subunit
VTPFELQMPASLEEAIGLLDPDDASVRPIAGGTALMLMMKAGVFAPTRLVSLAKAGGELTRIAAAPGGNLTVGAMTPLAALERSREVAASAPVIVRTMQRLSNIRVRNVATVGGALAHGDPHMDLPPVLIALGASVTVAGPKGRRTLAIEDLLIGYYETALAKNELIAEVHIPAQGKKRAAYMKVTTGSADDWPALGVAVALDTEGAAVKSARIVVSAATEKATRLKTTEKLFANASINDKLLARAGDAAVEEVEAIGQIITDVRGSAPYKRELLRVYLGRAIKAALASNGAHR